MKREPIASRINALLEDLDGLADRMRGLHMQMRLILANGTTADEKRRRLLELQRTGRALSARRDDLFTTLRHLLETI